MPDQHESGPSFVRLEQLKYGFQQRVGAYTAESLRAEQVRDHLTGDMVIRLAASVLAEELPPVTAASRIEFTVPRYASWFDHLVATHWGRWWARLLRWHRRELRYVDEPHTHATDVEVRTYWTYPRAGRVLPGQDFGHVVLKTQSSMEGRERTW